ncbi:MAG: patatin-like phospholipase family protein [Candidatus Merdivicinus sp.]
MKRGLVLEGGGMRGLYTAGVLDYFMDAGITFDYCIGVSAGACHATSYLSCQRGRSFRVNTAYLQDERYLGLKNFLKTGSMFGMDFIFDKIPNELDPFDYETFLKTKCEFYAGVTDVATGKPAYFGVEAMNHDATVLRASSAIPVFSPIVEFRGRKFLDGGTSDPIPVKKALADGCDSLVIVLTQHRGYVKSPEKFRQVYKHLYGKYPEMVATLDRRHQVYNDAKKLAFELEKEGKAIVIAPEEPVGLDRFEKDLRKLRALYEKGYNQAKRIAENAADGFFRP